jgi:YVTN family beta-propeller protein
MRHFVTLAVLLVSVSSQCFAQSKAYIAAESQIQVVDLAANKIVAAIPLQPAGSIPTVAASSPDGKLVFVNSSAGPGSGVFVISTTTDQIVKMIPTPCCATDLTVSPDGRFLYVLAGLSYVVIDTATLQMVATVPLPSNPQFGIAVSPDSKTLYVIDRDGGAIGHGRILVIDASTHIVVASIPFPGHPDVEQLLVSPDGRKAYIAQVADRGVTVVDLVNRSAVTTIATPGPPWGVGIGPSGTPIYAVLSGCDASGCAQTGVAVIDSANTITSEIPNANGTRVAFRNDGAFAYVAAFGSLSAIRTVDGVVTSTLPIPLGGFGIALAGPASQSCIPDKVVAIDIADSCGLLQWLLGSKWSKKFGDGTTLEVSCSLAFNNTGFPAYMAWFTDSSGGRSRIAQCLFRDGFNDATYMLGHASDNPAQSCLASVAWRNIDGGTNDGPRQATDFLGNPIIFTTNIEPYIDVVDYLFDANDKKLSWKDEKFSYPDTTQVADQFTVGDILTGRAHPVAGLTFSVDPLIGPELDSAFNTAWLEMQSDPGGPMKFIPGCDLNGDGVCDSNDQAILSEALGKCSGQTGYLPRIDYDGDGCIGVKDAAVVQASFSAYRAGCVQSQGYWKNHPANWPMASLSIGGNQYSENELLAILKSPVGGNGAIDLAHQLIAAKLNIASGASPIAAPEASADALLNSSPGRLPPLGNATLSPSLVSGFVQTLTRFNEGLIGPPACKQ